MTQSGLVSVVIPNFNYARYLPETIRSVLGQTYSQIEIIVVDDGSTDESLQVLHEFQNQISIIQSNNNGSCAARNLGMLSSSGDYIAFLDSDDSWDQNKIELQVMELEKANADLVFCKMRTNHTDEVNSRHGGFASVNHEWFLRNPASTPFAPSTVLMTRKLAARVGSWNTSLTGPAEDFDFFRRCAKFGSIRAMSVTLVTHRQHEASLTAINLRRYMEDNRRALLLMFAEDSSKLNVRKRSLLWVRFHFNFLKHAIKVKKLWFIGHLVKSFLIR